jgi:5-(carboxyamino)imidazole ribonucleotide mutase
LSPSVGILVGSQSDLPIMEKCTARLEDLSVDHELEVLSAHRNPDAVAEYVASAPGRGVKVFICAAGMAAHLAGAVAARTNLPVIGIPISAGPLNGFDALLATVQMPSGVPVATVAVNGAANAGVLAAQILALSDSELAERMEGGP